MFSLCSHFTLFIPPLLAISLSPFFPLPFLAIFLQSVVPAFTLLFLSFALSRRSSSLSPSFPFPRFIFAALPPLFLAAPLLPSPSFSVSSLCFSPFALSRRSSSLSPSFSLFPLCFSIVSLSRRSSSPLPLFSLYLVPLSPLLYLCSLFFLSCNLRLPSLYPPPTCLPVLSPLLSLYFLRISLSIDAPPTRPANPCSNHRKQVHSKQNTQIQPAPSFWITTLGR